MLLYLMPLALAYSTGRTGSSTTGCTSCHGTSASTATTVTFSAATTTVAPGESVAVSLVVRNSTLAGAGLNVSATGGSLSAGSNTRVSSGEVTHSSTQALSAGAVTFNFSWTAPTTEGSYSLRGAGNAVDRDTRADSDDRWALASNLVFTVDDGCDDLDLDGFESCDDGSGADCDDADPKVFPGADETCDGEDDDCDGSIDEDATDGVPAWPDADGDGAGDAADAGADVCELPDGWSFEDGDCDDADAAVYPGAPESCDGVDEDCDGRVDEDASDSVTYFMDADGDGYGTSATTVACSLPAGYAAVAGDCDDTRAAASPAGAEVCDGAGVDEDCDGAVDDSDASVGGTSPWYLDIDGDGYGDVGEVSYACVAPAGYVSVPGDCADDDASVSPGATESCLDAEDLNCDGSVGYSDVDGDGVAACLDCDDGDAASLPGGTESCDGADNDCDGTVDESDAVDALTWYRDADADGWGDASSTAAACDRPEGYAASAGDCDDADATARPDAPEIWYDGVDQDCDGNDSDRDGDGVPVDQDCDDTDAAVTECDSGDTGDTGAVPDTGSDDTGTDGAPSDPAPPADDASGCGCAATPSAGTGWFGALAVALAALRRRGCRTRGGPDKA
jgi:MYXO-CTERM domain-containing protein